MFYKFLGHSNPIVFNGKNIIAPPMLKVSVLCNAKRYDSSRRRIFHCIPHQIDKNLIQLQRVCDHILIDHFKGIDKHIHLLCFYLGLYNIYQVVHQFRDIALLIMNLQLSALNTAHIQNVIDQAQQMITGGKNFLQTIFHLILSLHMAGCNGCKTDNSIHRCTYIVAHIGKESSLGLIGMLCLHQGILKGLGLLTLLPHLFRNVLRHYHSNNIIGVLITGHYERLADTYRFHSIHSAPVIHIHFHLILLISGFQQIHIYRIAVILQRLRQNKLFPSLKTFGGFTRNGQPCPLQQRNFLPVIRADNILHNLILCQVALKSTKGIGHNSNPVLPFLSVKYGAFPLLIHFFHFQFRNILADKQNPDRLPIPSFQAHSYQMFPFFFSMA